MLSVNILNTKKARFSLFLLNYTKLLQDVFGKIKLKGRLGVHHFNLEVRVTVKMPTIYIQEHGFNSPL